MDTHRNVASNTIEIINIAPPFSSISFVSDKFNALPSLRRCFSIARSFGMSSITIEDIVLDGIIKDENDEITAFYPKFKNTALKRIAFWKKTIATQADNLADNDLIGYSILKYDTIPNADRKGVNHRWTQINTDEYKFKIVI